MRIPQLSIEGIPQIQKIPSSLAQKTQELENDFEEVNFI